MHVGKLADGSTGAVAIEQAPLGKGGEGSVYSLKSVELPGFNASELVAKIYHDPTEGRREAKIAAMLASPPESDSVAWPLASLYKDNAFVGYLMTKLPSATYRSWADLANTASRKKNAPKFDVRYAIVATENLGIAIKSIHDAGHRVGDVNESNILVASDSRVMIVDTDSAQIRAQDGTVFPCIVGKQEYTAPELTRGSFRDQERTESTDLFAYAVAAFQMLTGGAHPTDGRYVGNGEPSSTVERIRSAHYPGLTKTPADLQPLPRVPVKGLPRIYKNIISKSLAVDPSARPNLDRVLQAAASCRSHLKQCSVVKTHWYDDRESCTWCENAKLPGSVDPWGAPPKPAQTRQQSALPSLDFQDEPDQPTIRRAPVQTPPRGGPPGRSAPPSRRPSGPQVAGPAQNSAGAAFPPGFGSSQSVGGTPQSVSAPTAAPQASNAPRKIKGKMNIAYADGTFGPRPPWRAFFRDNRSLAWYCFLEEFPTVGKFWWPSSQPVAPGVSAVIGAFLGLTLALSWLLILPQLGTFIPPSDNQQLFQALVAASAIISAAAASMAVTFLFFSMLIDHAKAKRSLKPGYSLRSAHPLRVIVQYISVAIFWGPLFIAGVIIGIGLFALNIFMRILEGIFAPPRR